MASPTAAALRPRWRLVRRGHCWGLGFQATRQALVDPRTSKAIIDGSGQDTVRSTLLDIARGSRWPRRYSARTLGHPFLDQWYGQEAELDADAEAKQAY